MANSIESGIADLDAPSLNEHTAGLKAIREQASVDAERAQAALDHARHQPVSPDMVKTFARAARQSIRLNSGVYYRRDHLPALPQAVEVADTEVPIMGSKSDLLRTLVAKGKSGEVRVQSRGAVIRASLRCGALNAAAAPEIEVARPWTC